MLPLKIHLILNYYHSKNPPILNSCHSKNPPILNFLQNTSSEEVAAFVKGYNLC